MNREKKIIIIVGIVAMLIFICLGYKIGNKSEIISYKDYIKQLGFEYNDNIDEILNKIDDELKNNKNDERSIGLNLVARQHYLYLRKDDSKLIANADITEKYLIKHKMDAELLHVYSILASRYTGTEKYTNAYIYIYKGEKIASKMYEKNKLEEDLSTLIAIRYLKSVIALEIGMENEADKVFQEAEELRLQYAGRERTDVYHNILLYYQYKEDYQKVEEYANKQINLTEDNKTTYNDYRNYFIDSNIILANSYLKSGKIDKCIEIIKMLDLEENYLDKDRQYNMYKLYASVYKYYGDIDNYIKYLELAYNEIEGSTAKRKKAEIANNLLQQYEIDNNKEKIIQWSKIYIDLTKDMKSLIDTQYIMSQIINTDLQNANSNIDILKLQKSNLTYVIVILILIVNITIVLMILQRKRKKLLKENIRILEKQMNMQHDYYENIKKYQEYTRAIRHDMTNHINVVIKLLDKEDYKLTKDYVKKLSKKIVETECSMITSNKIIDAILINKSEICKSKNIELELDVKVPEVLKLDELDLCTIYGNLLDNAIEACEKITINNKKYIKVKSLIKGDYLFLNIKNSKINEINKKENKFITNKIDKINHGIGLENIKRAIEKYDGEVKITYSDSEFSVNILLKI